MTSQQFTRHSTELMKRKGAEDNTILNFKSNPEEYLEHLWVRPKMQPQWRSRHNWFKGETDRKQKVCRCHTNLRSASISLVLLFRLKKKPPLCCTLYWMLWKLTVEPHGCLFWSTAMMTFDLPVPLVSISSTIAMLMWLALSIILCSEHPVKWQWPNWSNCHPFVWHLCSCDFWII